MNVKRSKLKDVPANCFCTSLLCTKGTCHVIHRARALSSEANNNRANGIDTAQYSLEIIFKTRSLENLLE